MQWISTNQTIPGSESRLLLQLRTQSLSSHSMHDEIWGRSGPSMIARSKATNLGSSGSISNSVSIIRSIRRFVRTSHLGAHETMIAVRNFGLGPSNDHQVIKPISGLTTLAPRTFQSRLFEITFCRDCVCRNSGIRCHRPPNRVGAG